MRKLFLFIVLLILGFLVVYYFNFNQNSKKVVEAHPQPTPVTCNALTNISPKSGDKVTSPLIVTVTVDNTKSCKWTVFEAQAGILTIKDSNNQVIGTTPLTTTGNWMTNKPVVYTGTISFAKSLTTKNLKLTISEEDPSGQGAQTVTIPLTY